MTQVKGFLIVVFFCLASSSHAEDLNAMMANMHSVLEQANAQTAEAQHDHSQEGGASGAQEEEAVTYVGRVPETPSFVNGGKTPAGAVTYVRRDPATPTFINGGKGDESGTTYVRREPETPSFHNAGRAAARGVIRVGR